MNKLSNLLVETGLYTKADAVNYVQSLSEQEIEVLFSFITQNKDSVFTGLLGCCIKCFL